MTAKLEIEMKGAAFAEAPASELARILRDLADRIEGDGDEIRILRDINGNKVGKFEVCAANNHADMAQIDHIKKQARAALGPI